MMIIITTTTIIIIIINNKNNALVMHAKSKNYKKLTHLEQFYPGNPLVSLYQSHSDKFYQLLCCCSGEELHQGTFHSSQGLNLLRLHHPKQTLPL